MVCVKKKRGKKIKKGEKNKKGRKQRDDTSSLLPRNRNTLKRERKKKNIFDLILLSHTK